MRIDILTLFPEMFDALSCSIIKRGLDNKLFEINVVDIRDFTKDIHKKCDDYPYGGGAGMVMMPQPIFDAFKSVKTEIPVMGFIDIAGISDNEICNFDYEYMF